MFLIKLLSFLTMSDKIDGTIFVCSSSRMLKKIIPIIEDSNYDKIIYITSDIIGEIVDKNVNYVNNQQDAEKIIHKHYKSNNDFLISAYWPWKFSKKIVDLFLSNSVNFHPSPLPKDRGWYPHVHQIRNKTKSGVTLHKISEDLDKGEILAISHIDLKFPITSGEAYEVLLNEMVKLFKNNWEKIKNKELKPLKQNQKGNFLSKFLLDTPEIIEINDDSPEENILRIIASRNLNNKSYIKIRTNDGIEKFIHLNFTDDGII